MQISETPDENGLYTIDWSHKHPELKGYRLKANGKVKITLEADSFEIQIGSRETIEQENSSDTDKKSD